MSFLPGKDNIENSSPIKEKNQTLAADTHTSKTAVDNEVKIPKVRLHELDWLRVLAFSLLVIYHGSSIFTGSFYVANAEKIPILTPLMTFISQWRLPLLFFISGASVAFLLNSISVKSFLYSRFTRILIPLIFGVMVLNPPQSYVAKVFKDGFYPSYFPFHIQTLAGVHFASGETLKWNHLWYLVYIFVFSIVLLPLFLFLRNNKTYTEKITAFLSKKGSIYLLALLPFVTGVLLMPHWPFKRNLIYDWDNFATTILFFIYGYIVYSSAELRAIILKNRFISLILGILCMVSLAVFYKPGQATAFSQSGDTSIHFVIYKLLKTFNTVAWLFCILGFGQKYLRFQNGFINYATEAVYPFYILHQTVMLYIAFFVVAWPLPALAKYLIMLFLTFACTLLIYEFVIKKTAFTRFIFGMKPKKVNKALIVHVNRT